MPLVPRAWKHYSRRMRSDLARRLLVLLLSVALATGVTVRVAQAGSMEMTAVAMAADMPMHGKCDGCAGNEKAMAPSACFTHCASVVALPASTFAFNPPPQGVVAPAAETAAAGHIAAPEPYPPRPTIPG